MHDAVLIAIAREPRLLGYVAFNRHLSAGLVGDTEVDGLRLLGPHFRRAVTIGNLFDMKAMEAATFRSAIDALVAGVALVDEELGLVHANPAAEAMLRKGGSDPFGRGRADGGGQNRPRCNRGCCRAGGEDEGALGPRGIGIPLRREAGGPSIVHVLPLPRARCDPGLCQSAVAALFRRSGDAPSSMPMDTLALLYNLTPAEVRVFEMVCAGKTQADIAAESGSGAQHRQVAPASGLRKDRLPAAG